jgi:cardiolipin synthase C
MHNKQMIADNRAAIIGGRNIGDEYFGLNADFNFHDLDVLGVGPVARQASAVFDRYWNSAGCAPPPPRPRRCRAGAVRCRTCRRCRRGWPPPPRPRAVLAAAGLGRPTCGAARPLAPGRSACMPIRRRARRRSRNHMPEAFRALMRSAAREVLITNAYIIPDAAFMRRPARAVARGVRCASSPTRWLRTTCRPSTATTSAGGRRCSRPAPALHELRADAAIQRELVETRRRCAAGFVGLHTKAMVVDRERSFIGSMNLDPRSEIINSEMGVVIDSPPLAEAWPRGWSATWRAPTAGRRAGCSEGGLRWVSDAGTLARSRRATPGSGSRTCSSSCSRRLY